MFDIGDKKLDVIFNLQEDAIKLSLMDFIKRTKNPRFRKNATYYINEMKDTCYIISAPGIVRERKKVNKNMFIFDDEYKEIIGYGTHNKLITKDELLEELKQEQHYIRLSKIKKIKNGMGI